MGRAGNLPRELLVVWTLVLKLRQKQMILQCVLNSLGPREVNLPLNLLRSWLVHSGRWNVWQRLTEPLRALFADLSAEHSCL